MNLHHPASASLLHRLAVPGPIFMPVAMVVAHQDDEMIGIGGNMARLLDFTLIHVTDGAPAATAAANVMGYASRDEYAAIRRAELDAALAAACAHPVRRLCYAVPDGDVASHADIIMQQLAADLMPVEAVITHPYEGGHVDHDACARAVHQAAATLLAITGRAPAIYEFASYYHQHGEVRAGGFWPDPACPAIGLKLNETARRRREAAFACFTSQTGNLGYFSLTDEYFRNSPDYDFSQQAQAAAWRAEA